MSYTPKYCCECGDRIEDVNKGLLASRRFCQLCETSHKLEDWMPRIILGLGILFGIIGIGGYFQIAERSPNLAVKQLAANQERAKTESANEKELPNNVLNADDLQAITVEDVQSKAEVKTIRTPVIEKIKELPNRSEQKSVALPVYFCGAETKKGTACSRKVKGGGRCWQHEGREAMMPQKDLLISR